MASKTVRPISPNRGAVAYYRDKIDRLIKEMSNSYEYWIAAAYKKFPPAVKKLIAEDALPASSKMSKVLASLNKRWEEKFQKTSEALAARFANKVQKTTDFAFQKALKDAGWTIEFRISKGVQDILASSISENVALIKSIQSEYHTQIEGIVMRGYSKGSDLAAISKDLQKQFGVTKRRAAIISRDQGSKINANTTRARQAELGITKAKWVHSAAGKKPRPDHVAANGKEYNVTEGCLISGEYILPGEKINCRCTSRSILPF